MRDKYTKPTTISAIDLYWNKGELLIPDVQRDLVWTNSQKQLLIDSIIKDFDIPKIYFRDVIDDDSKKYEVIDGQQRINAIITFMNNGFELAKDSDTFEGEEIAGKKWDELSTAFQIEFQGRQLDVVHLTGYSQEEIDETFLRLQNGTPLKAAEKRRAISGNMRNVVKELGEHSVFGNLCSFENTHFAYEDVAAKIIKLFIDGGPTTISAQSLTRMYEQHHNIQSDDKCLKSIKKALNFIEKAFKNTSNPHLKRYALMDLAVIADGMLNTYDVQNYANEFGKVFLEFSDDRIKNSEKNEDEQDPKFLAYANAARGDSLEYIQYRQEFLRSYIIERMPYLSLKDNNRTFTADQRAVIFRKSLGHCAICNAEISETDFEADHIKPWSKGGLTQIANGQALCVACNRKKSDSEA